MLNCNLIKEVLDTLAKSKVFWSEMDFQLSMAWEIKQRIPEVEICLERRYTTPEENGPIYIDIWIEYQNGIYPIELKYKTKQEEILMKDNQVVLLKEHGACDLGRYGFIRDIARIEKLTKLPNFVEGYAIILTNDPKYYLPSLKETIDEDFKIHEGKVLKQGLFAWRSQAEWIKKLEKISLEKQYLIQWHPYLFRHYTNFKFAICTISRT